MNWFQQLFVRRNLYRDLSEEIQQHLAEKVEEQVAAGMSRREATAAARRAFGNLSSAAESSREVWRWPSIEDFFQDVRYGLRMLGRSPGFTAVAVLTLALGIGANTAIFSVVYALLLKPLPYANSRQLFNVFQGKPQERIEAAGWSYLNFAELRRESGIFTGMAGTQQHQLTLTGRGEPSVVNTSVVTPDLFSLFGEKPLAGRVFFPEDGQRGAAPVVVLSENLWRGSFRADPKIVGRSIDLDKRPFTVIGVMPASFTFPRVKRSEQLWIPLVDDPLFSGLMSQRSGHWLQVTGRLNPGISVTQAQAELAAVSARLAKQFPAENGGWIIRMVPLQQMIVGNLKSPLLVLFGAVGLVLLIACANIANLLLTRATSRAREISVRAALGAPRTRIIRQLLSETALLGLLGGGAGILLAYGAVAALNFFLPPAIPRVNAIRVDYCVLAFAFLLSGIASCLFGLAPALFMANSNLQASLREGNARSGESGRRRRARTFLAAGEVALAMVLLVAAGLLIRSFSRLTSVSPGFAAAHIVKADISLPRFEYSKPRQWIAFSNELLTRLHAEPGLENAAIVVPRPIADRSVNLPFDILGSPLPSAGTSRSANYVAVSPGYFHVMGIPLVAGRFFNQHDILRAPRVSLISRALAGIYFPNQNPIGKRLRFGFPPDTGTPREIVGVVGDVRDVSLGQDPGPMMYVPYAQAPFWSANLVVKSTLNVSAVATAIRRDVQEMDKDLPVTDVAQMPDLVRASVAEPRFRTLLLTLFAALALVLAATGIFGVTSYSVSCRTSEIGIRAALGATRGAIARMILRETLLLTFVGLAIGVPCALAASRLVGHMLFGISPNDPVTLSTVAFILAGVAALAGYLPARRAMRVDPLVALRHE